MAGRRDGRPRHEQIAADLRDQIIAGDLPPGAQLPSTQQLMNQYEASNTSVGSALNALKDEGFVTSRVGKGVYVRDKQPFAVRAGNYFAPSSRGWAYKLLAVGEVTPPADVRTAYSLAPDGTAILRHRLMTYNDEPVELSWSYYPADLARGTPLAGKAKIVGGAPQMLAELGHRQAYFEDEILTRPPKTEEIEGLDLPDDVSVLRQFRVVYSENDRPVEVSVLIKGGHLYTLKYRVPIEALDD